MRYELALLTYHAYQSSGQFRGLPNLMQDLQITLDWDPDFAEAYNMLAMARLEGGRHSFSDQQPCRPPFN